jgi:hypothetical protein
MAPVVFFTGEFFCQKENQIRERKKRWFWRVLVASSERKKNKINHQIPIYFFHCVAKHAKGWLKIFILFLVYDHIWLNVA